MKLIKVTENNEGLYTLEAYQELRLQMSTGDFHTHVAQEIEASDDTEYIDFGMVTDQDDNDTFEFWTVNERGIFALEAALVVSAILFFPAVVLALGGI